MEKGPRPELPGTWKDRVKLWFQGTEIVLPNEFDSFDELLDDLEQNPRKVTIIFGEGRRADINYKGDGNYQIDYDPQEP